jgi:hypothetical protein
VDNRLTNDLGLVADQLQQMGAVLVAFIEMAISHM